MATCSLAVEVSKTVTHWGKLLDYKNFLKAECKKKNVKKNQDYSIYKKGSKSDCSNY